MAWNALPWAVSISNIFHVFAVNSSSTYKHLESMPESAQSSAVKEVAMRCLNAENIVGKKHHKRVQDMIQELPEDAGPKTIESWLQHRLKVVNDESSNFTVSSTGTDNGRYYIVVHPRAEIEESLPWIITHEFSHILNQDTLLQAAAKTIMSLSVTALSMFALGLSWPFSLGAAIISNHVVSIGYSQWCERVADDFATKHCSKHCSKSELENAITFLEKSKTKRGESTYYKRLLAKIFYPSEDSRIAKIRKVLELGVKEKIA